MSDMENRENAMTDGGEAGEARGRTWTIWNKLDPYDPDISGPPADGIEVCPASERDQLQQELAEARSALEARGKFAHRLSEVESEASTYREALERFASYPCEKFPKEDQPHPEWNCQLIRDDHRENAADYTAESNAEAERVCDSCLAREALSSSPDTED